MHIQWPGFSTSNTLVIPVDKREFNIGPSPLKFAGRVFKPKPETHITVFGSSVGAALLQKISNDPDVERKIILAFEDTDWSYEHTSDLRRLVRESARHGGEEPAEQSIIMLVKMAGLADFYQKLKALGLLDIGHPLPPPHVTLYTYNCDTGIGVHSAEELSSLTAEMLPAHP